MNSTATAMVTDFFVPFGVCQSDQGYLRLARVFTALIGVVGTAMACLLTVSNIVSMLDQFMAVLGLFGGAICGVFMLGMLTQRANAAGGLIGIVAGSIAVWLFMATTDGNPFLYAGVGTTVTFVFGYLASRAIPSEPNDHPGLTIHG